MAKFTTDRQLDEWFSYHAPVTPEVSNGHASVREACRKLAQVFSDVLPECPDKTVALRAVREAMYHANACLAVQGKVYSDEA